MDLIEIKLIWKAGFFSSIKKILSNKSKNKQLINIDNFDILHLDIDEI